MVSHRINASSGFGALLLAAAVMLLASASPPRIPRPMPASG
jgi:hypothetical protein